MRYTVISSDCHAAPPMSAYRDYVAPGYRGQFDSWLGGHEKAQEEARRKRIGGNLFDEDYVAEAEAEVAETSGGLRGAWDSALRLQELENDGVAAEVIFTNGSAFSGPGVSPELRMEGARAYNRWLAELCAELPGRRAGVAMVNLHDLDAAIAEIRHAREAGLFGGMMIPAFVAGVTVPEPYNHPRYEPLWDACEDLAMPVCCHGGDTPRYGELPGSLGVFLTEVTFWGHRPFWQLIWSGVFDRHPKLRFMITEQTVDWIPSTLEFMDYLHGTPLFRQLRAECPEPPSSYYQRQCWAGASFMTRGECELRHGIGIDKVMYGTDYPHVEGTWPHTATRMRHTFEGVSEAEAAAIFGENAAEAYGFDLEALRPIGERIGPDSAELAAGPTAEDLARNGEAYLLR